MIGTFHLHDLCHELHFHFPLMCLQYIYTESEREREMVLYHENDFFPCYIGL